MKLTLAAVGFVCMCIAQQRVHAQDSLSSEAQLRAAFVFSLMKFVAWPDDADRPLVLCHRDIGRDDEDALRELRSKQIKRRSIRVRAIDTAAEYADCHALVLGSRLSDDALINLPPRVLVIGERDIVQHGGMVGLDLAGDRISMVFNIDNIKRAQLEIPAQVLALGAIVK